MSANQSQAGTPSLSGTAGYVNMPSASVQDDGSFGLGYSYDAPYSSLWMTATVLPALQVTGRFVTIRGIPGFTSVPGQYGYGYGAFKDKVIDAKLRLLEEGRWTPAVAVGATDLLGTELFRGQYLVATKTFGAARNIEASIGYGKHRPDGLFAGARWTPQAAPRWSLVGEYDANNYPTDFRADATSAGQRRKGPSVGLEYRWGWLGAQLARSRDQFSANLFATIPLSEQEFIPKVLEPGYFQPKTPPQRADIAHWHADPAHAGALVQALSAQNFKNVRVAMDGVTLKLVLTNNRISEMGRAVGRAARTALAFAPLGTRAIQITYTKVEQPVATYEFVDIHALADYLGGLRARPAFLQTVVVRPANPGDRLDEGTALTDGLEDEGARVGLYTGRDGESIQISSEDREDNKFKLSPKLNFFFNDPSGALRYDIQAAANYDRRLGNGLYLNSALRLSVFENISGVTQPSNSLLPHVRTDIAEYKRASRFKLNRMVVNQFLNPAQNVYARVSAGLYEEMYRGVGVQALYLPDTARWAADLSVDALQQRDYKGWFGGRDYRTVQTIGALHYRLPMGMTVTARAGKFLARDTGVRLEFARRFRSGVEVGAWYAKTNGNDITSPGTPTSPYHDKGVFLSIPLRSMLPMDSQASAGFAISPWTRDVGQMVLSPGDLYDIMEQPQRDLHAFDGLGNFAERADERMLPAVSKPEAPLRNPWPEFRMRLSQSAAASPSAPEWLGGATLAGGAILAGAALDKPVERYVSRHQDAQVAKTWGDFGKNMPIALAATAGIAATLGDDRMRNTGVIALQSIAGSLGVTMLGKYAVGRARPEEGRGPWAQVGEGYKRSDAAFPSGHSATAFAAVTPFAQEYDAPWLYGVAAVTSMGRVAGHKHWVSDVVAGSIVGYTVGTLLWKGQRDMRDDKASQLTVAPGPKSLTVAWQTKY